VDLLTNMEIQLNYETEMEKKRSEMENEADTKMKWLE